MIIKPQSKLAALSLKKLYSTMRSVPLIKSPLPAYPIFLSLNFDNKDDSLLRQYIGNSLEKPEKTIHALI